jgi:hypothetical protein
VRDGLADELGECIGADVFDHADDHVAFAFDGTDDGRLARTEVVPFSGTEWRLG